MRHVYLTTLALFVLATAASAQRSDTVFVVHGMHTKDPATGTILGLLLPGAGQMYAGKVGEGVALLGVAIAAPLIGAHIESTRASQRSDSGVSGTQYVTAVVGFAAWAFGWSNAAADAESYNASGVRPTAFASPHGIILGFSLRR